METMKSKQLETKIMELAGAFDSETLSVEVDGELVELSTLSEYDGCDIVIKLIKAL